MSISITITLVFFFSSRRRHTRYIGDWSSDVCSSDLGGTPRPWYRSNSRIATSVDGAFARIVPRTVAAGKRSSTRIERSRTIDGWRGSATTRRPAGAPAADRKSVVWERGGGAGAGGAV